MILYFGKLMAFFLSEYYNPANLNFNTDKLFRMMCYFFMKILWLWVGKIKFAVGFSIFREFPVDNF